MNKIINRHDGNKFVIAMIILSVILPLFMPILQVYAESIPSKSAIEMINVEVEKVWIGDVKDSVEIVLLADNNEVARKTITKLDNWKTTFENLLKLNKTNGKLITYTIKELKLDGYEVEILGSSEEGFIITSKQVNLIDTNNKNDSNNNNKAKNKKTHVNVEKKWIGEKGSFTTINLLANDVKVDSIILNNNNNWKHTFDNLNTHYEDKDILKEYNYSIEEIKVEGYESIINNVGNDYVIVNIQNKTEDFSEMEVLNSSEKVYYIKDSIENKSNVEEEINLTSVKVDKIWMGEELSHAVVSLVANNVILDMTILTKDKNWSYTFNNLPTHKNGKAIDYSVVEHKSKNYESEITGNQEKGFTIKNYKIDTDDAIDTATSLKRTVSVKKVWEPDKEIESSVALISNGELVSIVSLTKRNKWAYTFLDLPVYDRFNKEIEYSIMDFKTEGYDSKITGSKEYGFVITSIKNEDDLKLIEPTRLAEPQESSIISEVDMSIDSNKNSLDVVKIWVGKELANAKVNLLADGRVIDSVVLTKSKGWKHTFEDLPLMKNDKLIDYKVEELEIDGYKKQIGGNIQVGFVVINTEIREDQVDDDLDDFDEIDLIDLKVKKVWIGEPADQATIMLIANDIQVKTVILDETNDWEYMFKDLPSSYKDSMTSIIYEVEEVEIDGYEVEITNTYEDINDGFHNGFIVTNYKIDAEMPHDYEKIDVHVRAQWIGKQLNNNTAYLMKDDLEIDTVVLSDDNKWEYSFRNLDKYDNDGRAYDYYIAAEYIRGYKTEINSLNPYAFIIRNEDLYIHNDRGPREPREPNEDSRYNSNYVEDVQTYDGSFLIMVMGLVLSIVSLAFVNSKKRTF